MTTTNTTSQDVRTDNGNQPDWVAKSPRGSGRNTSQRSLSVFCN